jgi:hypothetical protein
MNTFDFMITDEFHEIEFDDDQKDILKHPSGLINVLLISNYWNRKYRLLDFRGTTNEEAIKKILTFYKHKTYRRLMGDHIFYEGFTRTEDGYDVLNLGS